LADFGITSEVMSTMMVTSFGRGTPGYRAPELLVQDEYDNKVDIWAVGCILHELVTGMILKKLRLHVPIQVCAKATHTPATLTVGPCELIPVFWLGRW